ncbi:hypothetical protein HK097_007780 [Rhizophlyctis rosea]|uniref:Uncharacterized protein n=1 Tax=Rhizophlyctis rosea TaxID=64517 RepID=A0AAD5X500_9FUNG|nr:hypothetical protein HK097_007780 [Rhizophlyctis rosea]
MPSDPAVGTLDIKVISASAPSDKHYYRKEAFAKVSLDETNWRRTPVRPGSNNEVVTYDRENDKEESVGRGKVNLKEEKLVDKGSCEIETDLHHHLRPAGSIRLSFTYTPSTSAESVSINPLMKMAETEGMEANSAQFKHRAKKHSISLKGVEMPRVDLKDFAKLGKTPSWLRDRDREKGRGGSGEERE